MRRIGIVSGLAFWLVVTAASSGSAGGSVWHFDDAEYQPGDIAETTTSVSWSHHGALGTPGDGPFVIYLAPMDAVAESWPGLPDGSLPVGIVEIHPGPYLGADGEWYGPNYAVARFEIPDVAPGEYQIAHCNSPCTTTLGDIIGGWDLHVIAGQNGRPPAEIADEVWSALEEYPPWTEPETTTPGGDASERVQDMVHPPPRSVSAVEPPSDPVSAPVLAPDSDQLAVSSEPVDPESPTSAIGFWVTLLAVLIVLLLIPLVDRIGWLVNWVLQNRRRTATFEAMVDKETTSESVQKDEPVAARP